MSFLRKLQNKVRKFRKNVNRVKEISRDLRATKRTLNSMRKRAHRPASDKLEEVKITAKKRSLERSEGRGGGRRVFGIFGKDERGLYWGRKRGPG